MCDCAPGGLWCVDVRAAQARGSVSRRTCGRDGHARSARGPFFRVQGVAGICWTRCPSPGVKPHVGTDWSFLSCVKGQRGRGCLKGRPAGGGLGGPPAEPCPRPALHLPPSAFGAVPGAWWGSALSEGSRSAATCQLTRSCVSGRFGARLKVGRHSVSPCKAEGRCPRRLPCVGPGVGWAATWWPRPVLRSRVF